MRYPRIGDIVKFIGDDGKWAYTRIISFESDGTSLLAVLELQSGPKKGFVGSVPTQKIKWNGKFFEADFREEEDK